MPSMNQHLSDIENMQDVMDSPARRHSMSTDAMKRFRADLLSDSFKFTVIVCGHMDLIPEYHMPLSYAACGLTDKLIWSLTQSGFDGYVVERFREEFFLRHIDLRDPAHRDKVDASLDWVNIRWSRGTFKSSVVTHGGATFTATRDPNTTAKITHARDDKAWEFCGQIAETIRSGPYRDIFPDRVPEGNLNELLTTKKITLGGRTISHPQTTIQALGYLSKEISAHYDTFWTNDLVVGGEGGNATPALLPGVTNWIRGMTGLFMPTKRIRRIHEGTKWDEDDDDTFLTKDRRRFACLTIRVPIEVYDGPVTNILERGTPTLPKLYPVPAIQAIQDSILSDDSESDGARIWRCNYLLDAYAGSARLFPPSLVDDPDNWWKGPFRHPKDEEDRRGRFVIARYRRDKQGRPLDAKQLKRGKVVPLVERDDRGREVLVKGWREAAALIVLDPWKDLDRICLVDPAWVEKADNWAVSGIGVDPEMVELQLATRSATSGMDGWIDALAELDEEYHFRAVGFDGGAYQDRFIQNLIATDKRLRRLRSRMVKVPHRGKAKIARIREGVAELLHMHRLLLDPTEDGTPTRDEMKKYKGGDKAVDGILDSLAMAPAVYKRRRSREEQEAAAAAAVVRDVKRRRIIDPALGVPFAA